MSRGHKKGSGTRANMYSESRFSNWTPFNPYEMEVNALPSWSKPALTVEVSEEHKIAIVAHEPHKSFVSPVTAEEVKDALLQVPKDFLKGLTTVYILGGTARQEKVALGNLFRFGCYWDCRIVLHAFPKRLLTRRFKKLPPPDIMHEYKRVGGTYEQDREGWLFQFSLDALREFHLRDVLLHEIGHHVDRAKWFTRDRASSERYARWFATVCDKQIREK